MAFIMSNITNERPTITDLPYRLAIVGDFPGTDEEQFNKIFIGTSGRIITNLLANAGILREASLFSNITQTRPNRGDFSTFDWNGEEIQNGIKQLKTDIEWCNPNIIILLGNAPLHLGMVGNIAPGRDRKGDFVFPNKISVWRGSLFTSKTGIFEGRKCIGTFHPSAIIRNYDWMPLLRFDIQRAREESFFPELTLPTRVCDVNLPVSSLVDKMDAIQSGVIAIDIEGGLDSGMKCISIATSANYAFLVPFNHHGRDADWQLLAALKRLLENENVGKILQNSLYDNFVLIYGYKIHVRNVCWDTMLSGWEIYPELPKSLATQTSIWTREPFYKADRKTTDLDTFWRYCCKDSMVTYEIAHCHETAMTATANEHFGGLMDTLNPFLYMKLRGIKYNSAQATELMAPLKIQQDELQTRLDALAGHAVNISSPAQIKKLLYEERGLPIQKTKTYSVDEESKETADRKALLALQKKARHPEDKAILSTIMRWKALEGVRKQLSVVHCPDGRSRSNYNVVGTDTGRVSCSKSDTGFGTNLQTITKKLRSLYCADDGYYFFQCDLSGADGWTVAARCAEMGDSTMLLDYQAGLKPAKIIALMSMDEYGPSVNQLSRAELKDLCQKVDGDGWLYFACKRVQHGTNYTLGKQTMSDQILEDSYKLLGRPIYVAPRDCEALQRLYLVRYPGLPRHQANVKRQLETTSTIICASGHARRFFGRKHDHATFRAACAQEPQHNTTYITNQALLRLWEDPENRRPDGSIIIEPLHQVHDALCGQFPQPQTEWAIKKIFEWFQNPIQIGSTSLIIPFEGGYGPSWGELPNKI